MRQQADRALPLRYVHDETLTQEVQKCLRVALQMRELPACEVAEAVLVICLVEIDPVLWVLGIFLRGRLGCAQIKPVVLHVCHSLLLSALARAAREVVANIALVVRLIY